MGEYATIKATGQEVKIGTCESLYYLRADQAELVTPDPRSVDIYRYRFPWPDEDGLGMDEMVSVRDFERSCPLWGLEPPVELAAEHYSVQFRADAGYNVCLPCPESGSCPDGLKIHRNGFGGAVRLVQQRYFNGNLVSIVKCGGCGVAWRLETLADAQPAIDSLIHEAERKEHQARTGPHFYNAETGEYDEAGITYQGSWHREVAARIRAGYES